MRVSVSELRPHLSAYLREVKSGQVIEITHRGQVIARLIPVKRTLDEQLKDRVAAGPVDWNGETRQPVMDKPRVLGSKTVADMLIEDRE